MIFQQNLEELKSLPWTWALRAVSGTPDNHKTVRVMCLSKMKNLWGINFGRNFALFELPQKQFTNAGGRLDHHGPAPYDLYIALLGTLAAFLGVCMIFFSENVI